MNFKFSLLAIVLGILISLICPSRSVGQTSLSTTENEAWPETDFHVQLPASFRMLSLAGLEQAAGYPFQQWYVASGIGRQFKPILRLHRKNIDPDKEHFLLLGVGYEYLRTTQFGKIFNENRVTFDVTPNIRPASKLLLRDRNWTELRWINGNYSTTYRNEPSAEVDLNAGKFQYTPFVSVEFFYDSPKHSFDSTWYTGGVQLPYKNTFMLMLYYRREQCSTCIPQNWNAGGASLNFYFNNAK